jgi:hypothetical protein
VNGIDETTWSGVLEARGAVRRATTSCTAAAVTVADAADLGLHVTLVPCGLHLVAADLPHHPGPYFGYWNSSMSEVMSFWFRFGRRALMMAFQRQVLDALRGPVGRISSAGMPQTFSV